MTHARLCRSNGSALVYAVLLALSACSASNDDGDETNKVNGSVHVPAGRAAADVRTINGSITVDDNGTINSADTVNGGIKLGMHGEATRLSTVNGGIKLGDGARAGGAYSVNGDLTLGDKTDVTGRVANTNGKISLTDAHVGGGIKTANGDITITGNSHVEGGIEVAEVSSGVSITNSVPMIVIGPGATVEGDLVFKRKVRLFVSDRAAVGPVVGATAVSFSGDKPPP